MRFKLPVGYGLPHRIYELTNARFFDGDIGYRSYFIYEESDRHFTVDARTT